MQAQETHVLRFLQNNNTQFVIPVYQRTYDWKEEHCEQLLKDILTAGENESIDSHFLGSIVYILENQLQVSRTNKLLVIDGQQRITTISILLTAMCDYIDTHEVEFYISSKELYESYLINSHRDEFSDEFIRLQLTKRDKNAYYKLIKKQDIGESANSIITNYKYFYRFLKENQINIDSLYNGLAKLMIVDVSLKRGQDNPQAIFESLNSTGLNLTQADLIRNYILMDLEINFQKEIYEMYWYPIEQELKPVLSDFIRHYLTLKIQKIPNQTKVYEEFKRYFSSTFSKKDKESVRELMYELLKYSKYYTKIVKQTEKDLSINEYLININNLDVNVTYPLIMKLYEDYENEILSKQDFLYILNLTESYILRRLICGLPTHSLKTVFLSIVKDVEDFDYKSSVEKILKGKKGQGRFPDDNEFKKEFLIKDIYNQKSNNRKYILHKLENQNSKEKINIDSLTIEHIMPQKGLSKEWKDSLGSNWKDVHDKYLHTIGNLTLTAYNSEMSNKSFVEKKDSEKGFKNSPLRLNQLLKNLSRWNEEEIINRGEELIELALNIWISPKVAVEPSDESLLTLDEDWTNKKPALFKLFDEEYPVKDFTDLYKKVNEILFGLDTDKFRIIIEQEEFRNRKFCSTKEDDFASSHQLMNSEIYMNTNLNSNTKKRNLQLLLEKFELDEQDLDVYL